jgi:UDP-N-acetylglucosamine--N-acetylmuramyl-(pentapeptide) pyrophosphoryl-undecaprenol N-acetylglucosamine transferase
VVRELEARGFKAHWLGARRGLESELVPQRGVAITLVEIEGMHARNPAAALSAATQLPAAILTALKTLLSLEPVAVLGVGGYASAAGVFAAGALGIPWVLQEQNSVPGWTNRAFAPWADVICCGFADAVEFFPSMPAEWTGNPVRAEFFTSPEVEVHDPPQVLVLGGSQGSLFLNRTVPRALGLLRDLGIVPVVRHQAGARWAEVVRTSYHDLRLDAEVSAFLPEPWAALQRADLVVARSGALTISELAAAGRGAVLIPFAAAAGNHQEHNARSLERAGGAVVMKESEVSPESLAGRLRELLGEGDRLVELGRCARTMALRDAAGRITERLLQAGGVA